MSDHVVQSYHDGNGRAGQSVHSYQSVWTARWTRTSCEAPPCVRNSDDPDSNKQYLSTGLGLASDTSPSAKGLTEVIEAGTVRIMTQGLTSLENIINERLDCQPFPMFRLFQNTDSPLDPKNDQDKSYHKQVSRPQIGCNDEYPGRRTVSHFSSALALAPPTTETSSRTYQSGEVSRSPDDLANSAKFVGDGSLALAGPSQDKFTGATPSVLHRFRKGKSPVSASIMSREELGQLNSIPPSKTHALNTNFTTLGHEHDNYQSYSAVLVCEKNLDNLSTSVKSETSFLRHRNASQLLPDSFAGTTHSPMLVGECSQKMQSCYGTGVFPSCSNPPAATKSEKIYNGSYSLHRMPGSVHDTETMRICSTKSVEGLAGDAGAFSQTTRSLLFMQKTDVNLSKEKQTFKESKVSAQQKRNMFGELLSLSPPVDQNQQRLKLQHLSSSTESEGKDNVDGVETSEFRLKNESSAETDTMDMDGFKEQNYLSGVNSSPLNKETSMSKNPPSQPTSASAGEKVGFRYSLTMLPDINEEVAVLPAEENSMNNAEPSTSRTESLDAEHLLSHAEQPSETKSGPYRELEPSSRWLKRLKLSTSDSLAIGTKYSNLGEASSHGKFDKLFSKIMEGSKSSRSEPMVHKRNGKEEMAMDQTAIVVQNGESSSLVSAKKGRDILLSHPWIQRWCHNQAVTHPNKPEAVVVCEPQSMKVEFDELKNKQFPSIAAMALMGKVMSGFQPCEFQRRGSSVVWNAKGF